MKKIAFLLFISIFNSVFSQEKEPRELRDLKLSILYSEGRVKVQNLIAVCEAYQNSGFNVQLDSLEKYAGMALENATQINDLKSISKALVFTGFAKFLKSNVKGAQKDLMLALGSGNLNENFKGHAKSYLGGLYFEKYRKFDSAAYFQKQAIEHFHKSGNRIQEALAYTHVAMDYIALQDYENAVEYCGKAVVLGHKLVSEGKAGGWINYIYAQPLNLLIELYKKGGDYASAKHYLKDFITYTRKNNFDVNINTLWADIYKQERKYDSALYYLKLHESEKPPDNVTKRMIGETSLDAGNYHLAIHYLRPLTDSFRSWIGRKERPRAKVNTIELSVLQAKAHYELQNHPEAKKLANEALELIHQTKNQFTQIDESKLLATAYQITGKNDSALVHYQRFKTLQDSLINKQFLFKLNNIKRLAEDEKTEARLSLLQKDNLLKQDRITQEQLLKEQKEVQLSLLDKEAKLKQQQINQEELIRQRAEAQLSSANKDNKLKQQEISQQGFLRNNLIVGFAIFVFLSFVIFRSLSLKNKNERLKRIKAEDEARLQKLENEKRHAEFQREAAELEMHALRAQMNPHFIFNCLSSINWLIMDNNKDAASDYLTRFSRLIRMVLINSEQSAISLEEELKMLQLYLDMERLRFENSFDYHISIHKTLNPASIPVPPLLLQPFCENAIWHGLMPKDGKGTLNIEILGEEQNVYFIITDDGVGRKTASELNNKSAKKHKSMGLKITADRIALFNDKKGAQTFFEIEDMVDASSRATGTRVMIKIKNRHIAEQAFTHEESNNY
jgi:hypothetical protein